MATDKTCAETMLAETTDAERKICDICNRELRSASEWLCSNQRVICDTCYQNLLDPDKKISFDV